MYTQDYDETNMPEWLHIGTDPAPPEVDYARFWPKRIQPYIKNWGITTCPDDDQDGPDWVHTPFNEREFAGININDIMSGWDTDKVKLVQLKTPATKVHFADGAVAEDNGPWTDSVNGYKIWKKDRNAYNSKNHMGSGAFFMNEDRANWEGAGGTVRIPIARHNGTCNVVFFDGHAKAVKLSTAWLGDERKAEWNGPNDLFGEEGVRGATLGGW
jgi:prepilin-type processing-associated H-X9-DG protein